MRDTNAQNANEWISRERRRKFLENVLTEATSYARVELFDSRRRLTKSPLELRAYGRGAGTTF